MAIAFVKNINSDVCGAKRKKGSLGTILVDYWGK